MSTKRNHLTRRATTIISAIAAASLMFLSLHPAAGAAIKASVVAVKSGDVRATITMPIATASGARRIPLTVDFAIAPGWHIYGHPLPQEYQPTTVTFDKTLVAAQSLRFPKPKPVEFKTLGQTLPVYEGDFRVPGVVVLKRNLAAGTHQLTGKLSFQECNDMVCKMPTTVSFALPITVRTASH
ncbi:MAG: protein-disulfide reductase DsbD domain-containing protein [Candidatus Binataceae bacterium]